MKKRKENIVIVKGRISARSKERVEEILKKLNLTHSEAIGMFYAQIEMHVGMPFEVRVSTKRGRGEV